MSRVVLNSAYLDKFINYASQQQGDVEDLKRPRSRVAFGVLTQVKKYRPEYLVFSRVQTCSLKYLVFFHSTDLTTQIFSIWQQYTRIFSNIQCFTRVGAAYSHIWFLTNKIQWNLSSLNIHVSRWTNRRRWSQ